MSQMLQNYATSTSLLCAIIISFWESGVNRKGVFLLIDQILSFYSNGQISAEAVVAQLFISQYGTLNDSELASKMHKHPRTIKRYRAEMAKLPPVSKFVFNHNLTNQQEELQDPISEVLSKYGKMPLLPSIRAIFVKHNIIPDAKALDYIVKCVIKGVKCGRVKNFSKYLLYMIPVQWGEALVETQNYEALVESEGANACGTPAVSLTEPEVDRPIVSASDPVASAIWNTVCNELSTIIPKVSQELLIKQITPISLENNKITLSVSSTFARDYIQSRLFMQLDEQFSRLGYNYCLTA